MGIRKYILSVEEEKWQKFKSKLKNNESINDKLNKLIDEEIKRGTKNEHK